MSKTSTDLTKTPAASESWPGLWNSFRSELDSLFNRFDGGFGLPAMRRLTDIEPFWSRVSSGTLLPAIDLVEDDKAYTVSAELPGLDEKDVAVSVSGDLHVLKGEKSEEKEEKEKNRYLPERSYGAFERSFRLPDNVERDKIDAKFAKGVLTVTLPKSKAAAPDKKIHVKAA